MSERLIVGLTGMPATGKGFVGKRLVQHGCELYSVKTTLETYASDNGIKLTGRADTGRLFRHIFVRDPMLLVRTALAAENDVVIDSVRVPAHAELLRHYAPKHHARFVILATECASDEVRFERAMADFVERGSRDPITLEAFVAEGEPEILNCDPYERSVQTIVGEADYTIDTLALDKPRTLEAVDNFWSLQH